MIAWQAYAQGEYVGHDRLPHVPVYRLRVDDQLDLVYRLTREETGAPYRLEVGDEIQVESFTDAELNRTLILQPDGSITLRLLGQVKATGKTVTQLRDELEQLYSKFYKVPAITVTPLRVNTRLEDLRAAVDRRYGEGGQNRLATVTPEELAPRVAALLAAEELLVTRERKGKAVTDDIRPAIRSIVVTGPTPPERVAQGAVLEVELATQPRAVRPAELLAAFDPPLEEGHVCRLHQWIESDGARREPLSPATRTAHAEARAS